MYASRTGTAVEKCKCRDSRRETRDREGTGALPSQLGGDTLGPATHAPLAQLIEREHADAVCHRQEVELDADPAREERLLKKRDVGEEHGEAERDKHRREQAQVARPRVEDRVLLENREPARTSREQVKPLQDDQVEEINLPNPVKEWLACCQHTQGT